MPKRGGANALGLAMLGGLAGIASRGASGKPGYVRSTKKPRAGAKKARAAMARLGAGVARYRRRRPGVKQYVRGSIGGAPSFSKFMLARAPDARAKVLKRAGAENILVENNAQQLVVAEGFQNAAFYSWQNFDNCKQILTRVPGGYTAASPKQFLFESTTAEFLMTNSSLATLYVDIYDIVRKRDPGYFAGNQDDDLNPTNNPFNAWKVGVSDEIQTSPDMTAWQNINTLPTDSRLFKDFFKVIKRSHIPLAQGATHRHHVMLRPNKLVDSEMVNRSNGDLTGLAVYTLIVAYGQPASIKGEGGTVVTTASGAIDIVAATRQKYTFVVDNVVAYSVVDNLSSLAGEQVVSQGAGQIVSNSYV